MRSFKGTLVQIKSANSNIARFQSSRALVSKYPSPWDRREFSAAVATTVHGQLCCCWLVTEKSHLFYYCKWRLIGELCSEMLCEYFLWIVLLEKCVWLVRSCVKCGASEFEEFQCLCSTNFYLPSFLDLFIHDFFRERASFFIMR